MSAYICKYIPQGTILFSILTDHFLVHTSQIMKNKYKLNLSKIRTSIGTLGFTSSLAKSFRSTTLPINPWLPINLFMGSEIDRKPLASEDVGFGSPMEEIWLFFDFPCDVLKTEKRMEVLSLIRLIQAHLAVEVNLSLPLVFFQVFHHGVVHDSCIVNQYVNWSQYRLGVSN